MKSQEWQEQLSAGNSLLQIAILVEIQGVDR
jgi:hypothetical protein